MTYGRHHGNVDQYVNGETENGAVALLALAAAEPVDLLEGGGVKHLVVPEGATPHTLDLEEYGAAPRRKKGTATFLDPESFALYFERHGNADTFLYASQEASTVTAVFNDDLADDAGWGDHRAVLQLQVSPEWKHWRKYDGQLVPQDLFAEHIDLGLAQITSPPAMDIKELVEDFEVVQRATFRSGEKLSTGERKFVFVEENQASGGGSSTRELTLPPHIVLQIAPWIGADAFEIVAKFSYRVRPSEGGLKFRYQMVEPHVQLEDAFRQVTGKVGELTGAKVLQGSPTR